MSDKADGYSASRGRRFALTLAVAFGVIALVTVWRDRDAIARVSGALAVALAIAGTIAPARLGPLETAWMKLAHLISKVTTPVFMGIVYFVVLTPAGLIRRTFGKNPLVHSAPEGSYWVKRIRRDAASAGRRMERQF